jgi:cation:H+ antiporter
LARLIIALALPLPAMVVRVGQVELSAELSALTFGAAVVGAAILLAWAAETAQLDISGSLAIAVLALIAILPEYAVDLYFAYTAGSKPEYAHYAAANMTGSNRLLLGFGWPLVAFVAGLGMRKAARALRRKKASFPAADPPAADGPAGDAPAGDGPAADAREDAPPETITRGGIALHPKRRIELFFLGVAALYSFIIPLTGTIALYDAAVLLGVYCVYLWRASRQPQETPYLEGVCYYLGCLPRRRRRLVVGGLFLLAAVFILASAEPFAEALVQTGRDLGIDEFLLVQWLAPLVSESPELIVACLLAYRLKTDDALGTLLSSKVNQWTLLVGAIPLAFLAGGGDGSLGLDARQTEEFVLTSAQTLLGFAVLIDLRFRWWEASALAALFFLQFPFPETSVRLAFSAAYVAMALAILIRRRRHLLPLWRYTFSKSPSSPVPAEGEL